MEGKHPTTVTKGSRHILAALRFLASRGQLTKSGARELADGASLELALLAEHVRPGARAFLDETYDRYLAACDYDAAPKVDVFAKAWERYRARFDIDAKPVPTPYQALLREHALAGEPDLEDLLYGAGRSPKVKSALAAAVGHVPARDAKRVRAFLAVGAALDEGKAAKLAPLDLLGALGFFATPAALPLAARAFSSLGARQARSKAATTALARVIERAKRADFLRLPARTQRAMRDALHALLAHEGQLALLALRVAADASSLAVIEAAGTLPDEPIEESYRFKNGRAVVAKRERAYEPLRRAIAKVVQKGR